MSGEVCTEISAFLDAGDPDRFLTRLDTSRTEVIRDLGRLRRNLEQVEAEGYGWQNVVDSPGLLPPKPATWLLAALRLACERNKE